MLTLLAKTGPPFDQREAVPFEQRVALLRARVQLAREAVRSRDLATACARVMPGKRL